MGDTGLVWGWQGWGGCTCKPYQVPGIPRKPEHVDPEAQHVLSGPGGDESRAGVIRPPINQAPGVGREGSASQQVRPAPPPTATTDSRSPRLTR